MRNALSYAAIGSFFGIGIAAAIAPDLLARNYGIPMIDVGNGRTFVRAMGARDAALGAIALAFALRRDRSALRTTIALSTIVAVGDFALVASARGFAAWPNLAIHGTGIAGLILAAAVG